ncbi:MAG: choice-of-anchor J domain-containing protein, partial [Muribaculaceae bacterium]|nr:choice-of-anchor J domain-containing protein [Muribaculaceae bacterium]
MNSKYIKSLALFLGAGLLGGCGENAWNDHLDGFEVPPVYSQTETVNYTLTAKDYETIAGLKANKDMAAADGEANELKAIGTNAAFSSEEQARKYLPAFIADSSFPYFALNNGSSVKVTYALTSGYSEVADAINASCIRPLISTPQYMEAWGSDEDYIDAFAPVTPASAYIPGYLLSTYRDAVEGDYALVSYKEASQNPIFTTPDQEETTPTTIEESFGSDQGNFTIEDITLPEGSTYVWKWAQYGGIGYMQASGYVNKQNLDSDSWLISPAVKIEENAILSFQYIVNFFSNVTTAMNEFTVAVREQGGNWTTLAIPNQPSKLSYDWIESGDIDLAAWKGKTIEVGFHYVSTTAKAGTLRVTDVKVLPTSGTRAATRAAIVDVPVEEKAALYCFNGTKWVNQSDVVVLQKADYTAMGSSYGNLQDNQPQTFIPIFLKSALPYAKDKDQVTVVYLYYNGSNTNPRADVFDFNGIDWTRGNTVTDQFTRTDNIWKYNPSVIITLAKGTDISKLYYQTCVNWVYQNIDVPLGSTSITSGVGYVTSFGNNEYYSGASAYQSNVDLRPASAKSQYRAGYEDMTDEEIVELEKYRFCYEVFPEVLSELDSDARTVPGMEITYTINFMAYQPKADNSGFETKNYQMVYKVTGPGEFAFVSCTWWENGYSPLT